MDDNPSLKLSAREITRAFSEPLVAGSFPPVLTIKQAAELLSVPVGTLRDWRSRGQLTGCGRRVGKHVRFFRDRLVEWAFNTNTNK